MKSLKKGKTYEELYGVEKAIEIKEKQKGKRGKSSLSKEQRKTISERMIGNKLGKSNKGRIFTKEHKEKLKLFESGHIPWNKDIPMTSITKEKLVKSLKIVMNTLDIKNKISKSLKGKYCGEKASNWQGGLTHELYGIEFNKELKEQIRKRDNYTCKECNIKQDTLKCKLSIHHIDYNKKNNDCNNLICLCKSCHMRTNFNRDKWIKHFKKTEGKWVKIN